MHVAQQRERQVQALGRLCLFFRSLRRNTENRVDPE